MNTEEKKLRHTQPGDENQIGNPGQGQPTIQPVKQSTAEQPTAIPVKRRFENVKFYNPRQEHDKRTAQERDETGGKKTGDL